MDSKDVIGKLKDISNPDDLAGMARFGINTDKAFGVRVPVLRKQAREIGTDHKLPPTPSVNLKAKKSEKNLIPEKNESVLFCFCESLSYFR
jgi:3-methyladenine DNA glycosylase AlkD